MRVFITDDEAPARRELRYLLEQVASVELVGEAANSPEALKGIRETKPELVFLDIHMPGMNGLELAQFLCELPNRPLLVFATAYDEYALQAFEVDAIDYLRKPFTQERVSRCCAKAERLLHQAPGTSGLDSVEPCRRIPLYRGESIIPTTPDQIIFVRSEDGEVFVHSTEGRYRTRCTLNELEHKLAGHGFIRPHRSFLINVNYVREVIPWFNSSYKLIMADRDRSEIPVSRYNVKELKRYFDL